MRTLLFSFFGCLGVVSLLVQLELIPWRRSAGEHWTERARRLYTARSAVVSHIWGLSALTGFAAYLAHEIAPPAAVAAAFVGGIIASFPLDRAMCPGLRFAAWARESLRPSLQAAALFGIIPFAAWVMPDSFNGRCLAIAAAVCAIKLALVFSGHRLYSLSGMATPAGPRLRGIVAAASEKTGVAVRSTWELDRLYANALAWPTVGELGFTKRLLAVCPDDEVEAVCRHEIGHLTESRWAVLGRIAGAFIFVPWIFVRPVLNEGREWAFLLMFSATWLLWLARGRFFRTLEHRADQAARPSDADGAVYARALERLHETNLIPAVLRANRSRSHPDLYDRMIAAGVTPAYPRPQPPASSWTVWVMSVLVGAAVGITVARWR